MKKNLPILLLCGLSLLGCNHNTEWISTTETTPWQKERDLKVQQASSDADAEIFTDSTLQTIEGFGACFNELGWTSLSKLSEQDRRIIFQELFAPGVGANFTVCRMPVGANDFSREWYSYDETEGDFEMNQFSIANDLKTLVPFIKAAQQQYPRLKLWASPWSPPSWMKWNKHYACHAMWPGMDHKFNNNLPVGQQGREGSNMFIQDSAYLKAYALYFAKFVESYRTQGIAVSSIMPQNEFNSCQIFPSCTWTASALANFIGKYLGPAMNKEHVEIMFGTMERPAEALVDTILKDPAAGKYVKGVGFQWAGKEAIAGIHKRYPAMKLYQSEQECGDGKNDWKYCNYTWSLMKHYFNNGVSAYMYWNISLAKGGFSRWGWQQNSLITVDTVNKTFQYNHEYYLMKHLSHFVMPGARQIKTGGRFTNLLAFKNPDQSLVLVLQNDSGNETTIKVKVRDRLIIAKLKSGSFNTIVLKNGF